MLRRSMAAASAKTLFSDDAASNAVSTASPISISAACTQVHLLSYYLVAKILSDCQTGSSASLST